MRIDLRGMTPLIQVFGMATSLMVMFAGTPYAHLHICGSPWKATNTTAAIPRDPVRRIVHGIETFNVVRGGEYFFMPSLSALRWLGELG
jgi:hypothetical protein